MLRVLLLALAALFSTTNANAQAYKCKTASDQTIISDSPCRDGGRTVSVVQSEHIPLERQQQAAALHEQRRAEVTRIDAEYDARVAAQQRAAAFNASANTGRSNYRDAACDAASKPYPGSQGGLTAAQLRTLRACAGSGLSTAENDTHQEPQLHQKREPSQLIDTRTGRIMPSIGGGNYIDPVTGTVMHGTAGGVVNTRTGQFSPTVQ